MNGKSMNLAVSCGGTGGHVFPGVATAQTLRRHGHTVTLLLAGRSIESATRFAWDGRVINTGAVEISMKPSRIFPSLLNLLKVYHLCRREFGTRRPDALLSMGSYASAGPVLAARRLGIPIVLHEANVIPGRATTLLGRFATSIAISFPETAAYLGNSGTRTTGLPLRKDLERAAAIPADSSARLTLLVMGGSQGARFINQLMPLVATRLLSTGTSASIIHLSGPRDRDSVAAAYANAGVAAEVHGFQQDMAAVYRRADFAISRAGANSCMELALFGIPALLIPYPHAARNHQAANARAMADAGAAVVINQADLSAERLTSLLQERINHPAVLSGMRQAARRRALAGADEALADLIEEVARPR